MKVEVQLTGVSIDTETYEGDSITWALDSKQLDVYMGNKLTASYPVGRVVRIRIVE